MKDPEISSHPEYRQTLIAEFLELLQQTESDPEKLNRYSEPQWLQEITLENLRLLIKNKKELKAQAQTFYQKYKPSEKTDTN